MSNWRGVVRERIVKGIQLSYLEYYFFCFHQYDEPPHRVKAVCLSFFQLPLDVREHHTIWCM